jgi:four helix bundle protein
MNISTDYKKLELWQNALHICVKVFQATNRLPLQERTGMFRKLRDKSEIIPMHIARGSESTHAAAYKNHLDQALETLEDIHLQVALAEELEYLPAELTDELDLKIESFRRQLERMIRFIDDLDHSLNPSFAYSHLHSHVA